MESNIARAVKKIVEMIQNMEKALKKQKIRNWKQPKYTKIQLNKLLYPLRNSIMQSLKIFTNVVLQHRKHS